MLSFVRKKIKKVVRSQQRVEGTHDVMPHIPLPAVMAMRM